MANPVAKREPTLADLLLARPAHGEVTVVARDVAERVQRRLRDARRFVFDDAAAKRYAEVVRNVPDLIMREQAFARAPYDITWVEFPFRPFWRIVNGQEPDDNADARVGFLIDHGVVYVVSSDVKKRPVLTPFSYELHQPWEIQDQNDFVAQCSTTRLQLDMFLWGKTYNDLGDVDRRGLRAHHTARVLPLNERFTAAHTKVVQTFYGTSSADLRNVLTILLLINRPSLTRIVHDVPHHRGFIGGKLKPYMSHSVVTIDLDPVPTLKLIGTSGDSGIEKRRHEVRGTWCHDAAYRLGRARGCVHEWVPHPSYGDGKRHSTNEGSQERDNWLCKRCEGHRWWRNQHMRGDSNLGFVQQIHRVTG